MRAQTARATCAFAIILTALFVAAGPAQALDSDSDSVFGSLGLNGAAADFMALEAAPPGVTESIMISGLDSPTAVSFAPDGRVFVAEKAGRIKVYDSLSDPSPTLWADFSARVHDFWDRGFLGMALDPNF